MPGLRQTGRMRKAIMDQLGLIRTKHDGKWVLIPCPPHKNREILYTPEMKEWSNFIDGLAPEVMALWKPGTEVFDGDPEPIQKEWRSILQLDWTEHLLPECHGCQLETHECSIAPPFFQCRILSMSGSTELRRDIYWKRQILLG